MQVLEAGLWTQRPESSVQLLRPESSNSGMLTISLVSKSIYFSRVYLRCTYFHVIICQWLKKMFKLVELFFSRTNEIKTCGSVEQLIVGMLRNLILQSRDFPPLNGDPLLCLILWVSLKHHHLTEKPMLNKHEIILKTHLFYYACLFWFSSLPYIHFSRSLVLI